MFELLGRPDRRWWKAHALACENAEIGAENDRAKRQQRQQQRQGRRR